MIVRTLALLGATLTCCASAIGAGSAPVTPVKASAAALSPVDLPGAIVLKAGPIQSLSNGSANYRRTLENATFEGVPFQFVSEYVDVAPSVASAHAAFMQLAHLKSLNLVLSVDGSGSSGILKTIRRRNLRAGDEAFESTQTSPSGHSSPRTGIQFEDLFFRVGTVVESLTILSEPPGLTAGQAVNLAKLAVARIKIASVPPPANTASPTITGTPALGQTLTAQPGNWTGPTPTYSYQWLRCNSAGTACAAIIGSTQETYTLSSVDQGQTVKVVLTATGASGAGSATSLPTALIS